MQVFDVFKTKTNDMFLQNRKRGPYVYEYNCGTFNHF